MRRLAKWFLAALVGSFWFERAPATGTGTENAEGTLNFTAYRSDERRSHMGISALFRRKQHVAKSPKAFEHRYQVSSDVTIDEPPAARSTVEKNQRMTFTPERDRELERELERERALESSDA